MRRESWYMASVLLLVATVASAQGRGMEISGWAGWTYSDGVSGQAVTAGDGNIYNRVDPQDSYSYGFSIAFLARQDVEIGFPWSRQESTLEISGTTTREIGDLAVHNYHGYAAWSYGRRGSRVKPYFLFGMGVTDPGAVRFEFPAGTPREIDGDSRFSFTLGTGVKLYSAGPLGARLGIRFTPTYVKSDASGYWCDPFWGCYVVGDPQYANQWEFSGGLLLRLGGRRR